LKEAFGAGEPNQNIDIARRAGFSPRVGAEDRDPLGTVPAEYRDDGLPNLLRQRVSHHLSDLIQRVLSVLLPTRHQSFGVEFTALNGARTPLP